MARAAKRTHRTVRGPVGGHRVEWLDADGNWLAWDGVRRHAYAWSWIGPMTEPHCFYIGVGRCSCRVGHPNCPTVIATERTISRYLNSGGSLVIRTMPFFNGRKRAA